MTVDKWKQDRAKMKAKFSNVAQLSHPNWTGKTTFQLDDVFFRSADANDRAIALRKMGYDTKIVTKKSTIINCYGIYKKK